MTGANPDYEHVNLTLTSLSNLNINLIVYLDSAGHLVSGRYIDLQQRTITYVPQGMMLQLLRYRNLLQFKQGENCNKRDCDCR